MALLLTFISDYVSLKAAVASTLGGGIGSRVRGGVACCEIKGIDIIFNYDYRYKIGICYCNPNIV